MKIKLFTISNLLTLSNLLCGMIATVAILTDGDLHLAFWLLVLAAVFDFFDGFTARLLHQSSPIGLQLDSLADMVSSGVAPTAVMLTLAWQAGSSWWAADTGGPWSCAAGGCIPAPGMQNCFYVLLPYLGEFLGAASVIWALAKLGTDWSTVREYNYKKSVAVLPVRTAVTAVFSLLGVVCELIFFFVNDHAGQTFFALLYVLLKLIALLSVLVLRAEIMQAEWDKLPKKNNF